MMQTGSGDRGQWTVSASISGLMQQNTAVLIIHLITSPFLIPVSSWAQGLEVMMELPPAAFKAGSHLGT